MTWLTCLLVYYNHFFGDFCIKLCCIFVDMVNWHLYIIMHIYLCMYTCYVSITYLLYIWYINLQHFFHVCYFCYFSYMLFIMNTVTIDMLGIYHRYIGVAWWRIYLSLWWGMFFMWCTLLFFVVHILLYIPQTFLNINYFVGIAYDITYTFAFEFSINFLSIDAYYNVMYGSARCES